MATAADGGDSTTITTLPGLVVGGHAASAPSTEAAKAAPRTPPSRKAVPDRRLLLVAELPVAIGVESLENPRPHRIAGSTSLPSSGSLAEKPLVRSSPALSLLHSGSARVAPRASPFPKALTDGRSFLVAELPVAIGRSEFSCFPHSWLFLPGEGRKQAAHQRIGSPNPSFGSRRCERVIALSVLQREQRFAPHRSEQDLEFGEAVGRGI